jgi:hypothetical protein
MRSRIFIRCNQLILIWVVVMTLNSYVAIVDNYFRLAYVAGADLSRLRLAMNNVISMFGHWPGMGFDKMNELMSTGRQW